MEPNTGEVTALESLQFTDEIRRLISAPSSDNASSFTALIELPAPQAVQLIHSPDSAKFISTPGPTQNKVKSEPAETESSQPLVSYPTAQNRSYKRKDREKVKGSTKKSKTAAKESSDDGDKLPYVHIRARRGQATDNHSLAERARREKINARMKLLQELVPGCSKISGTAIVLDEIINHVQSLQRQVEFLSTRLAAVNPRIDFNIDSIFAENGSLTDSNFSSMVMPMMLPEVQLNGNRQQYPQQLHFDAFQQPVRSREEVCNNYATPENSLLTYNSSADSASLNSNHLKMEL